MKRKGIGEIADFFWKNFLKNFEKDVIIYYGVK